MSGTISKIGNSLVTHNTDGTTVLFHPATGGTWLPFSSSNANGYTHIKELGDQLEVDIIGGKLQIGYPTGLDVWSMGPVEQGSAPLWRWPLDFAPGIFVIQEFNNIPPGPANAHTGIDITYSGIMGANIYAITDSVVADTGFTSGNGNVISLVADADGSMYTFYHMIAPTTYVPGQAVPFGTVVGNADTTGTNATGPHCHFGTSEVGWSGLSPSFSQMENPRTYMTNRGVPYPW